MDNKEQIIVLWNHDPHRPLGHLNLSMFHLDAEGLYNVMPLDFSGAFRITKGQRQILSFGICLRPSIKYEAPITPPIWLAWLADKWGLLLTGN